MNWKDMVEFIKDRKQKAIIQLCDEDEIADIRRLQAQIKVYNEEVRAIERFVKKEEQDAVAQRQAKKA